MHGRGKRMPSQYESGEKFIRVIQLYQRLCDTTVGLTTQQLSDELEVSPRSVQRYIATLRDSVGIDIEDADGRWKMGAYSKLPAMQLDRYQAVSLLVALRLLHKMRQDHDPGLVGALAQIARALTLPTVTEYVEQTIADAERRPTRQERRAVERAVIDALVDRTQIEIKYRDSQGRDSTRTVEPYFIEPRPEGRSLYIFAFDHASGEVRSFRMDRIVQVRQTGIPFEARVHFDVGELTAQSWGIWLGTDGEPEEVRLRFAKEIAWKVRDAVFHNSAVLEEESDGSLLVTLRVTSSVEMRPWILGWGGDVEVLAPEQLREAIARSVREASARYADSST